MGLIGIRYPEVEATQPPQVTTHWSGLVRSGLNWGGLPAKAGRGPTDWPGLQEGSERLKDSRLCRATASGFDRLHLLSTMMMTV